MQSQVKNKVRKKITVKLSNRVARSPYSGASYSHTTTRLSNVPAFSRTSFHRGKSYRGSFKSIRETGEEVTLVGVKHYPCRPRGRVGDNGNEGRVRTEGNRMKNSGESLSFSISPFGLALLNY